MCIYVPQTRTFITHHRNTQQVDAERKAKRAGLDPALHGMDVAEGSTLQGLLLVVVAIWWFDTRVCVRAIRLEQCRVLRAE